MLVRARPDRQGTPLIRTLCTYTTLNPSRRALFEFDKLMRCIYLLHYLRDPQLERTAALAGA